MIKYEQKAVISELLNENAELNAIIDSYQPRLQALKDENFELKESLKCFQKPEVVKVLTDYRTGEIDNLKAENERLKEEVETRDKLVEHFRKEAINWAKIANDCIKDIENYKQALQEIKAIAEKLMADNLCNNCDGIGLDANCQDTGCPYYQMDKILQVITKAEEE